MLPRSSRLAVAVALVAIAPVLLPLPFTSSDHLVFWYAGRLVASGLSPYGNAVWSEFAQRFGSSYVQDALATGLDIYLYPPWTAYAFVPFSLLPAELGCWAIWASEVVAGVAGAFLLAREIRWPSAWTLTLAFVLFATFEPFVIGVRWGPFDSYLLLGIALVIRGLRHARVAPFVAGALLVALKPHPVLIFILVVAFITIRRRWWRAIATTAVCAAAIATLTFIAQPAAITAVAGLSSYAGWNVASTTYTLAATLADDHWPSVAVFVVAAAAILCIYAVRGSSGRVTPAIAGATMSAVVLPYGHTYDQIVLAPALFVAAAAVADQRGVPRVFQAVLLVVVAGLVPWLGLFIAAARGGIESLSGLVPLLFAALLALTTVVETRDMKE